jgi:hypothetical protein
MRSGSKEKTTHRRYRVIPCPYHPANWTSVVACREFGRWRAGSEDVCRTRTVKRDDGASKRSSVGYCEQSNVFAEDGTMFCSVLKVLATSWARLPAACDFGVVSFPYQAGKKAPLSPIQSCMHVYAAPRTYLFWCRNSQRG